MNRVPIYAILALANLFLSGCGNREVRQTIREVEAILDERPAEALTALEKIDSTSLRYKPLRMHYNLLYAIALDKNHIDDGRYVKEMSYVVDWYERFGNKHNKLRSKYYYGDQLRGAGLLEDAAVQFVGSEKEAVVNEEWFFAGMSARSLYYIFAKTHNYVEELLCIKRAVDYYHLAGKEMHEDDAKIKLAVAFFDNAMLDVADSLFNEAIRCAIYKKDTVRYRVAMVNSVDVFLGSSESRPDSVIVRLAKAETVGYRPNAPALADYGLAYSLKGDIPMSDHYFMLAYDSFKDERERAFVMERDYSSKIAQGDSAGAFHLLRYLYEYVNEEAKINLEQSVIKAQNKFLESTTDKMVQEKRVRRLFSLGVLLISLLSLAMMYVMYKRRYERLREEESKSDQFKFACEELGALGFKSFDRIVEECYSLGNKGQAALMKAYKRLVGQFHNEEGFKNTLITKVDNSHQQVISRLKEQVPELGENQILLFACMVQGLSYTTMTFLMANKDKQYLYDRRRSLIKIINDKDPSDKELFMSFLKNRPTRMK
jgi:hypothetical protein